MTYSDKEMRDICRDPVRLRGYFWRVAMNARKIALQNRSASRSVGVAHPVNNYKEVFGAGRDLIMDAEMMDKFSRTVLENIDALVNSTLEK